MVVVVALDVDVCFLGDLMVRVCVLGNGIASNCRQQARNSASTCVRRRVRGDVLEGVC